MENQTNRVIFIIDGPNLKGSTNDLGIRVSFSALEREIEALNQNVIVKKKIFSDEYVDEVTLMPDFNHENSFLKTMEKRGYEIIIVPKKIYQRAVASRSKMTKSRTDQMITIHLMEHLHNDDFDTLVFFSGDGDYQFILERVKASGKNIIIISAKANIAAELANLGEVILLNDLLDTDLVYWPAKPDDDKSEPTLTSQASSRA